MGTTLDRLKRIQRILEVEDRPGEKLSLLDYNLIARLVEVTINYEERKPEGE